MTLVEFDPEMYFLKLSNDPENDTDNDWKGLQIVRTFKNYKVPQTPKLSITNYTRLLLATLALIRHHIKTGSTRPASISLIFHNTLIVDFKIKKWNILYYNLAKQYSSKTTYFYNGVTNNSPLLIFQQYWENIQELDSNKTHDMINKGMLKLYGQSIYKSQHLFSNRA